MVGGVPTPLKNMISSVGVIIPKYIESHKIHVPNHQPDDDDYYPIILMIIIPLHGSYGLCIYIYYNYVDGILQKVLCLATPNPNRNPQSQLSLGASKHGSIKHSINHGKFRLKPT